MPTPNKSQVDLLEARVKDLERQVENTSNALVAFFFLLEDTLNPSTQENLEGMMADFFEANGVEVPSPSEGPFTRKPS